MKSVLVADDTKNIRLLLTKCLELEGYTVLTATNGQSALEFFKHEKLDLAFLDIKMPRQSGTEVLKRIREMGIDIPVIIITAYATIKNAVDCTQMGAVAYLQKPFTADKVRSVLNDLAISPNECIENNATKTEINRVNRIERCIAEKEFSRALELLKTAISSDPSHSYVYLLFSKAYEGIGDEKNAVKFRKMYEVIKQ